ncbi:MAG: polysaccharide biosynthesis C-terminal domain-containing protein [Cryomorphaceae bacterium]|nr:polysaccharide biosynthesis C-terminal domain-containing protein [Cryomorphaceae bacterium]
MGVILNQGSRNTVILYIGVVIGAVNTLFLYPNVLPAEEFGLVTMIVTISFLMATIGACGTTVSVIKYFPYYRNNETGNDKGLMSFIFKIIALSSLLITLLFVFAKPILQAPFENSASLLIEYYYLLIPFFIIHIVLELFTSLANALYNTTLQLAVREILLRVGQTVLIAFYFFSLINIKWFLIFYMAIYGVSVFIIINQLIRKNKISIINKIKLTYEEKKGIFKYGGFSFLSAFSRTLSFRIDALMLSMLVAGDFYLNKGLEATAIYAIALHMTAVVEMPFRGINQIISPVISKAWKDNNLKQISDVYTKSTEVMIVVSGLMFILIWASIDDVLQLLPSQYTAVKYTFFWLGLGKLLNAACGSNEQILINSKKFKKFTLISILSLIITAITNLLLIPIYQTEGAAIATLFTYVIVNGFLIYVIFYNYKMQPFKRQNFIVIAVLLFCLYLGSFINISNIFLAILTKSTLISVVFIVIVYKAKLSPEINNLLEKLSKRIFTST